MKSAILEKGEEVYTKLGKLFTAIDNEQRKYNWLITNCECYSVNPKFEELFSKEFIWIEGEELTKIINEEDIYFIWGVFSAFEKHITLEKVLEYNLPFADGYKGFWLDEVEIQHPLASIEVVAWDSSKTIFISKEDHLVDRFRSYYPLSKDLSAQNTRDNSEIAYIEKLLVNELSERNIQISEEILFKKYYIWNRLYSYRENKVSDEDIIMYINKVLDDMGL